MPITSSLQYDAVVGDHDIDDVIPPPEGGLTGYRAAVRYAITKTREDEIETSWRNGAVEGARSDPEWRGATVFLDEHEVESDAAPEKLWPVVEGIGGDNGWYSLPMASAARGWLDKLVGGVGLRLARRHPDQLPPTNALDSWRVEQLDRGRFLRLRAEMEVSGRAWLEFTIEPREGDGSLLRQRAIFFPSGLGGRLYWFAILPFHGVIFARMPASIAAQADESAMREKVTKQ